MRSVKHGESHNIGLFIHYIIQSQEGEVLEEEEKKKREGAAEEDEEGGREARRVFAEKDRKCR